LLRRIGDQCDQAASEAPLPVQAQRKIFYENAARVYQLDLASLQQ
jgi:predicted TIM-barrel fold metal-dependent hydrolase